MFACTVLHRRLLPCHSGNGFIKCDRASNTRLLLDVCVLRWKSNLLNDLRGAFCVVHGERIVLAVRCELLIDTTHDVLGTESKWKWRRKDFGRQIWGFHWRPEGIKLVFSRMLEPCATSKRVRESDISNGLRR